MIWNGLKELLKRNSTDMSDKQTSWMEVFRVLTPLGIFIIGIFIASIDKKIDLLDAKVFHHLTNDEIHVPKGDILTRAEFSIFCDSFKDFKKEISDVLKRTSPYERAKQLDSGAN